MKKTTPNQWGGKWTVAKLEAFADYVNAYLIIMIKQREKYKGWPRKICYFDGFAGSGANERLNLSNKNILFDATEEELSVYQGAAERVLNLEKKFDKYYFVDIAPNNIQTLKDRLTSKGLVAPDTCQFIAGEMNEEIRKFLTQLDHDSVALVLLDPFGMSIQWESIREMQNKRVDLWILIPSGVIINRLLDKEGKLEYADKLENFFGLSTEEIKEKFYKVENIPNLFGELEVSKKIDNAIEKIAKLYVQQLKTIFKEVTKQPLVLKNSKNVAIYHFVFASNNKTALKIASQIIEKKQS